MLNITRYVAVDQLLFGKSSSEDCVALYGDPNSIRKNRRAFEEYEYDEFILRFTPTSNIFCELTLLPEAFAQIQDIEVTWDREFLKRACQRDCRPVDLYGSIVFPALGIAVSGIHDDDPSQLAVTVFEKGAFDDLIDEGSPFEMPAIQ